MTTAEEDRLIGIESYVTLVDQIYSIRESCISEMQGADDTKLRQLSGRILQADEVLTMMGWHEIERRRRRG